MNTKYKRAIVNVLFSFFVIVAIMIVVPKIWMYFIPFIIAWILALCAAPIVRFLESKIKIKRKMGSAIVIIAVIALIAYIFYLIFSTLFIQLAGFLGSMPNVIEEISSVINDIGGQLETRGFVDSGNVQSVITEWSTNLVSYLSSFMNSGSKVAIGFVGDITKQIPFILIGSIVCFLSAYFFVAEKHENEELFAKLIPAGIQKNWNVFSNSLKKALGGYVKAQVKIEVWIYLVLVVGLFILKVDYVLLIALIIAFLDFLPLFGAGIVMIPWAVISVLCQDYSLAVGLAIVWGITQILRQLIQPKYVGESIGIKPLPSLILLYLGYCVGGMMGLILAIPAGYVIMNLYKAGMFDTSISSIRLLVNGFNQYRKGEIKEQTMEEKNEENK